MGNIQKDKASDSLEAIDLGDIIFVIDIPYEDLTTNDLENLQNSLLESLYSVSKNKNYGFEIQFEIVSIRRGCVWARVKIWAAGIVSAYMIVANYPNFKIAIAEIIEDINSLPNSPGQENSLRLEKEDTTSAIYRVNEGDTLTRIVQNIDYKFYTKEQFMLGLLKENPHAFFRDNINCLHSNTFLKHPRRETMSGITGDFAKKEVKRQNSQF